MASPAPNSGSSPMESFLVDLSRRGFEPLLAHTVGSIGISLLDPSGDEHWHIDIDHGKVEVSRGSVEKHPTADATVTTSHELFHSATLGTTNLWTAMLRGGLEVEGDLHLLVMFQRLLPGPVQASAAARR